jgi:hypothetical protein
LLIIVVSKTSRALTCEREKGTHQPDEPEKRFKRGEAIFRVSDHETLQTLFRRKTFCLLQWLSHTGVQGLLPDGDDRRRLRLRLACPLLLEVHCKSDGGASAIATADVTIWQEDVISAIAEFHSTFSNR